jgi:hypothetical protein
MIRAMIERAKLNTNGPPPPKPPPGDASILELEEALRIDTMDLTNASAYQPELFYRVAKRLAALKAEHDMVKLALEEAEGAAHISIRENLPPGAKITVAEAEALVRTDAHVKALGLQLVTIARQAAEVQALKEAYSQRKSSLSDLVELQRQAGQPIDPAAIKRDVAEQRRAHAFNKGRTTHGK